MTDYPFNWNKPIKADTIANFCVYTEQNAEHVMRALWGYVNRPQFRWKDADEIYIGSGHYEHGGSTRQRVVWWNSELTYKFGPAGSNGSSVALGNNEWHYLYIDDSAVNSLASNELTAAEFVSNTTAPAWDADNFGWYTGNDRCIGAFRTGATANIIEFYHDGGDFVQYADLILNYDAGKPSDTWTDVTLTIPGFCTRACISMFCDAASQAPIMQVRTNGQTGAVGHKGWIVAVGGHYGGTVVRNIMTDSSQIIEVRWATASADNTISVETDGWYFPKGM